MTGIFKANNPYNNFLLFLYGFLLKLPVFLFPHVPVSSKADGFLYRTLLEFMAPTGSKMPFIYSIITFALLYLQAISLNKLANAQRIMQKPNYLTGMSYLLLTSLFSEWFHLSSALIINSILVAVLSGLFNLYNTSSPKSALFNLGMMTGVASFLYFPSASFVLLMIVTMIISRPFRLAEWLMGFIGILTPYYFFGAWLFLTDRLKDFHFVALAPAFPSFHLTKWAYGSVGLLFILIGLGIYFVQINMLKQVVQARKNWNIIFLYLAIGLFLPLASFTKNADYWILTAVPIAALSGAGFLYLNKKWLSLILHWAMVIISIVMGYYAGG